MAAHFGHYAAPSERFRLPPPSASNTSSFSSSAAAIQATQPKGLQVPKPPLQQSYFGTPAGAHGVPPPVAAAGPPSLTTVPPSHVASYLHPLNAAAALSTAASASPAPLSLTPSTIHLANAAAYGGLQLASAGALAQELHMPNSNLFAANRICPWCAHFCHESHIVQCDMRRLRCNICLEDVPWLAFAAHFAECEALVARLTAERVERRLREADEVRRRAEIETERRRRAEEERRRYFYSNVDTRGVAFDDPIAIDITDPKAKQRGSNSPPNSAEFPVLGIQGAVPGGGSEVAEHAGASPQPSRPTENAEPTGAAAPKSAIKASPAPSVVSVATTAATSRRGAAATTAGSGDEKKACKWCGQMAAVTHEAKCASRIVICKRCNKMLKMKDKDLHNLNCKATGRADADGK